MTIRRAKRHDEPVSWQVDESDYPRSRALEERVRFLVRYAMLAPSSHNALPRFFRITAQGARVLVTGLPE